MRKSILILALLLANPFYVICLAEQNSKPHTGSEEQRAEKDHTHLYPTMIIYPPTAPPSTALSGLKTASHGRGIL